MSTQAKPTPAEFRAFFRRRLKDATTWLVRYEEEACRYRKGLEAAQADCGEDVGYWQQKLTDALANADSMRRSIAEYEAWIINPPTWEQWTGEEVQCLICRAGVSNG